MIELIVEIFFGLIAFSVFLAIGAFALQILLWSLESIKDNYKILAIKAKKILLVKLW